MNQNPNNIEDTRRLLAIVPPVLARAIENAGDLADLTEIVFDVGRRPAARFGNNETFIGEKEVTYELIDEIVANVGEFDLDNRAGMERTLHRISAIRNRKDRIIGLTCRIGRAIFGTADILRDLIDANKSILILGRPGIGKTTILRETARILSERKRVVIVDTSNEIGGDGDIPHPAVGAARRLQVAKPALQHEVMIEAVENHNPEVIVIDEIGRESEALAARTIAERGVQLIGTAHGQTINNLIMNPTLSDLIGGIESVTLSDEEAKRRGTQKTVLERRSPPTFDTLIEIAERDHLIIYEDIANAVDALVRGVALQPESRRYDERRRIIREKAPAPALEGRNGVQTPSNDRYDRNASSQRTIIQISGHSRKNGTLPTFPPFYAQAGLTSSFDTMDRQNFSEEYTREAFPGGLNGNGSNGKRSAGKRAKQFKIYLHGVARNRFQRAAERLGVRALIANQIEEADALMTLRPFYRARESVIITAEERGLPMYVLRSNTINQIESGLSSLFEVPIQKRESNRDRAEDETYSAIEMLLAGTVEWVNLPVADASIRALEHQIIEKHGLQSKSIGKEPKRFIRIYRPDTFPEADLPDGTNGETVGA